MDWKSIVRTVAPTIGTALLGPLGGLATNAIASVLLPEDEASALKDKPAQLTTAVEKAVLGASPDTLAKLKQANNDFEVKMTELGIDLERVHAEDRASARAREVETNDTTPRTLAILYLAGFFALLGALFVWGSKLDPNALQPLNIMLGILATCVTGSKEYYFGSSASSAQKNILLKKS
jgi:hypothetical protein